MAGYAVGAQGKPAVGASDAITAAPWSDHDPYADAALLDPWLGYKQLRDALRDVLRRPLTPRAPRPVRDEVTAEAERLVEKLVAQGSFDAATDLANHLPVTVVSNLIGLPEKAESGCWSGPTRCSTASGR